jgi:hypothetical protein
MNTKNGNHRSATKRVLAKSKPPAPRRNKFSGDQGPQVVGERQDVVTRCVARSGLGRESFLAALAHTALGRLLFWGQPDLERLLVYAERLGLDPIGGEIYALPRQEQERVEGAGGGSSMGLGVGMNLRPDAALNAELNAGMNTGCSPGPSIQRKFKGSAEGFQLPSEGGWASAPVILVLSVDGWCRVINSHPQFDGMSFAESSELVGGLPAYTECTVYRKDRRVATCIREYMAESNTGTGAWLTHPRRMLRHKAMVQCARVCFGLGGLYEPDEAERIRASRLRMGTGLAAVPSGRTDLGLASARKGRGRPLTSAELKTLLQKQGASPTRSQAAQSFGC